MKVEFQVRSPQEIPPKSARKINQIANCSDSFFCVAENDLKETRKYICYYDFSENKWCVIGGTGEKKLIEYLTEK